MKPTDNEFYLICRVEALEKENARLNKALESRRPYDVNYDKPLSNLNKEY